MPNPHDDSSLHDFLSKQAKPAASSDDLARLAEHTSRNPPKRGNELMMYGGGGGLLVLIIVLKLVAGGARAYNRSEYRHEYEEPTQQSRQLSPAEMKAVNQLMMQAQKGNADQADSTSIEPAE
ncbi:hypothetical protein NA78x_005734 [Anatilimnocola sp. NA78]|uniref:hypothetical protein n=1 Tax=Anatilimnocola sp. NA78 TaxID=3415683 RepID=UPI003CE51DE0